MSEDPEFEPGVCVACKAAAETVFDPGGINAPACLECKEDGTFTAWLAAEFEKWAEENPDMEPVIGADGVKRWRDKKAV